MNGFDELARRSSKQVLSVPKEVTTAQILLALQGGYWTVVGFFFTVAYIAAYISGDERDRWIGFPFAVVGAFGCMQVATAIALGRLRPWSRWCCWMTSSISCSAVAIWLWRADDDPIFLVFTLPFVALFHFWGCASLLQRRARQAFADAHQGPIDYINVESEDLGTW